VKAATQLKPHEAAGTIARLLQGNLIVPDDPLGAVRYALVAALVVLKVEGAADVSTRNRWRCDKDGVADATTVYRLWCQQSAEASFLKAKPRHPPHILAADGLAYICLRAIERGHVIERDRTEIPRLLLSIVGFVPDLQSEAGRKKRKNRKPYSLVPIARALRTLGRDATGEDILRWLEDQEDWQVTGNTIQYFDKKNNREKTITSATFRNHISKTKKELPK
jgi:hypothetical protein